MSATKTCGYARLPYDSPVSSVLVVWHARNEHDPALSWLRRKILEIAAEVRTLTLLVVQKDVACFSPQCGVLLCHHRDTMYTDILKAVETGSQSHLDTCIVDAVIRSRRAIRAFRPDAVSKDDIVEILDVARAAPSNSNTQPWNVHVLHGRAKLELSEALGHAHVADDSPPLQLMPNPLPEVCGPRQEDFGARYYGALGIDKADVASRARATGRNFDFFGAPVGLILTIDARLKKYSWLDCGIFLQTLMLAARARGLDTCAQVSFARHHTVIAQKLKLEPGFDVVCGMSLGYADQNSVVNKLGIPRATVEQFATFLGFDG